MSSRFGEVAEWSNVLDSKSSVLSKVPRVRIPPSPPKLIDIFHQEFIGCGCVIIHCFHKLSSRTNILNAFIRLI